jgi:predicted MPP superfamily phosphohydrolase
MVYLIISAIPVLSLAWWIWAHRRLSVLRAPGYWHGLLAVLMVLLLGGFVWILLDRGGKVPMRLPTILYASVMLWGLMFLPFLTLPSMFSWGVWASIKRLCNLRRSLSDQLREPVVAAPVAEVDFGTGPAVLDDDAPLGMSRREMLAAAGVALPVIATFGTTLLSIPEWSQFRVRELAVGVANLPAALEGLRIVHLSDTHVGKFTKGKVLADLVETINKLKADLVLFTGDLIDNSLEDLPAAMEMLTALEPSRGLVMIEGNHDLFQGAENFARGVRAYGVTLLRDESLLLTVRGHPVQILGLRWHGRRQAIENHVDTVANLVEPGAFPILLAHHPHAFDRAAERGLPLTLAGHTHGGQIMLTPEFGAGPLMFKYWTGLYERGNSSLVVSNGAGNWFPLRTSAPAEIVHLTLRRA